MRRLLLISQKYPGSKDSGGNRVHNAIRKALESNFDIDIILLDLSKKCDEKKPNLVICKIGRTFEILFNLKIIFTRVKSSNTIVCDGVLSSLALLASSFIFTWRKYVVTIHHNNEYMLERKWLSRAIYTFIQRAVSRLSDVNIFFTVDDANGVYRNGKNIICLPILSDDSKLYLDANRYNSIGGMSNGLVSPYCAIPSNFAYAPNVEGLMIFYKNYRELIPNSSIIISTPVRNPIPVALENLISYYSDRVISFLDYNDYLAFLREANAIILPIFSGSGIQLKAVDSLFMNKRVYSSQLIRDSHPAFGSFEPIDELSRFNDCPFNGKLKVAIKINTGILFADEALDIAINR